MSSVSKISCVTQSITYLSLISLYLLHSNKNVFCFPHYWGSMCLMLAIMASECALILRRVNKDLMCFGISKLK